MAEERSEFIPHFQICMKHTQRLSFFLVNDSLKYEWNCWVCFFSALFLLPLPWHLLSEKDPFCFQHRTLWRSGSHWLVFLAGLLFLSRCQVEISWFSFCFSPNTCGATGFRLPFRRSDHLPEWLACMCVCVPLLSPLSSLPPVFMDILYWARSEEAAVISSWPTSLL